MGEKNLWTKLGLITVLVGLCVWQVYPPQKQLKPGIDLGGGHSLLFEIDDSGPEGQRTDLAERVMTILKNRVDPQGNRNLVWRPIGRNRLEIQMPRPPQSQREGREAYENARAAFTAANITRAQIRAALTRPEEKRAQAFEKLVGEVTSRRALFGRLVAINNEYQRLETTTTQPATGQVAKKMDQLFVAQNNTFDEILATNLDIRVLGDLLELDRASEVRKQKLDELKEQHPDLADQIDEMTEAHKAWSAEKGFLDDPSDLMRLLRGAGKLEFRILATPDPSSPDMLDADNPKYKEPIQKYKDQLTKYGPRPLENDNYQWFKISKPDENDIAKPNSPYVVDEYLGIQYVLAHSTDDMGLINKGDNAWALRRASPGRDRQGRMAVNFSLDARGGDKFSVITGNNINRPLCIFLDEQAVSAATIRSRIGTDGQISGNFTPQDVAYQVNTLEAGVLPARLKEVPLQQKSVGPSLGATNRLRGQQAIVFAFALTIMFMALYYTYTGVIADIALLMNLVLTLGVMSFLQATFTLPGIAGLILTLGMAVDANVLIYERIREELHRGVSVRMAVKLGYEKAFSAILDSNVTTIITAAILGSLGSEEIKGFGMTLGIGLCTSMFTALFVTRQYMHIMVPNTLNRDETRKAWLASTILALAGGLFFALGWFVNRTPEAREESALVGFGQFILVMFAVSAFLLLTLWVFRIVYRATGHQKGNRLPMMKLFSAPNINWMAKRRIFWTISAVVVIGGVFFAWEELEFDRNAILDIEFLGGTSVQVQLKDDPAVASQFETRADETLLGYINGKPTPPEGVVNSITWLKNAAQQVEDATVTGAGDGRYVLSTEQPYTFTQLTALLMPTFENFIIRGGITDAPDGVSVQFNPDKIEQVATDVAAVQERLHEAAIYIRNAAALMDNARVQLIEEEMATGQTRSAFEIITTETSRDLVAEALLASMGNILEVTQPIAAKLVSDPIRAPDGLFPIKQGDNVLADVLGGNAQDNVAYYKGGVLLVFDQLQPAPTTAEVQQRLREMRFQPDFEDFASREKIAVIGLDPAPGTSGTDTPRFKRIAIAVADDNVPYVEGEDNVNWRSQLAEKERTLAEAALASSRSLQRVTQFAPQVAGESTQKAIIAIILSMLAIAGYLWIRFGSVQFGLAGIIALYHDVAVTLSLVIACHFLHDTAIGKMLLLQDFKIDLAMIAAFLTIVGYSINDTIVIFDRIRENRGRLATISRTLINNSLNQTLSRTIITSFTTFLAVIMMYVVGGAGIHGFAFAMIVGVLSGTYSTIAIATPMLQAPRAIWVVTIIIVSVSIAGIALTISTPQLKWGILIVVAVLAVVGLVKQLSAANTEAKTTTA